MMFSMVHDDPFYLAAVEVIVTGVIVKSVELGGEHFMLGSCQQC